MGEVRYELKNSFKYAYKDGMEDASFITLSAPGYKHSSKFTPIRQAFTAAFRQFAGDVPAEEVAEVVQEAREAQSSNEKADNDSTSDAEEYDSVMNVLFAWNGDLTETLDKAASLFKSGVAYVDGSVAMSNGLLEKLSLDDFYGLVGCYVANFIDPSRTDGQTNDT